MHLWLIVQVIHVSESNWADDDSDSDGDVDCDVDPCEEDCSESTNDLQDENESNVFTSEMCGGDENLAKVRQLVRDNGIDSLFPPLDGTAFYDTICKINHSCNPNVIVKYNCNCTNGLFAELHCLRSISPGEELVQSYIDVSMSELIANILKLLFDVIWYSLFGSSAGVA